MNILGGRYTRLNLECVTSECGYNDLVVVECYMSIVTVKLSIIPKS